jgi:AcrR family transcriptional regulator
MKAFVTLKISKELFLKNPVETELGRKIVSQSILLIDEIGFEGFTFKKLAAASDTTEAGIYRYYESKHQLLLYLTSWYWGFLQFKTEYVTNNIKSPKQRLRLMLRVISEVQEDSFETEYIRVDVLQRIIISEANKSYLVKNVDDINKYGAFVEYKSLAKCLCKMILTVSPKTRYVNSIASMLLETARQQLFFSEHLPSLTDIKKSKKEDLVGLLEHLTFKLIEEEK